MVRAGFPGRMGPRTRGNRPFVDPSSLPGLKLWLDASDAATVTKDGSNLVANWNDKSGTGQHFTQSTAGNKPTWVDNQINGLPIIRFTYSGSSTTASRMTGSMAINAAETTFFMVLKTPTRTGLSETIFYGIGNISNGLNGSTGVINWSAGGGNTDGSTGLRNADEQAMNKFLILSGRRSAAQNNVEVRENGAVLKKTTHSSVSTVGQTPRINWDTIPNYGQSDMAAIVIYDKYLTDAQMLQVEDYLNTKFACYTNFTGRRALHRGVQRYCTANNTNSLAGLPAFRYGSLLIGQSNAGGEGQISDLSATLQATIPGAKIWNPTNNVFEDLKADTNCQPNSGAGTKHGTEITYMYDMGADFPTHYMVKWTEGGTSLEGNWKPTATGSRAVSAAVRVDAARYQIGKASGQEIIFDKILWYQGEADTNATYAPLYQQNEADLINYLRNGVSIPKAESAKFISAFVNSTAPDQYTAQVNAAKAANAASLPNCYDTPGWTTSVDTVHADSDSLQTIGNAMAIIAGATTQAV